LSIFTRFFLPKAFGIPGFNFLHFAYGRLPKGTIEKRREEKEAVSGILKLGFLENLPLHNIEKYTTCL